jgi:competence ComEA-like helix-hairpin-helix protein
VLTLTPAERRGALVVLGLLALGAAHDLWRLGHPRARELPAAEVAPAAPAALRPAPSDSTAAAAGGGHVDLNRASAEELDALPGIGPVLAERILAYRRAHGPFREPEDLLQVRGIGPRLFARLRSRIALSAPRAAP